MANIDTPSSNLSKDSHLFPVEEMLEIGRKQKKMSIGIPKETKEYENRISLTPQAIEYLINSGHQVLIENNAGKGANYANNDYAKAGASIVNSFEEIYSTCDMILKVAPFNDIEIELLKRQQLIFSSIHLPFQTEESIKKLMNKKVTAVAYEFLKDGADTFPVTQAMSEISGIAAIMIGAEYLSSVHDGKGVLLGGLPGITPAEVTILGAGTAGEYAARSAIGLGAMVKVFDNSISRLRRIQENLGQRIFTSVFHPQVFTKALKSTDVLIGAMDIIEEIHPFMVTEDMVKKMKAGSVIIDLGIDQGGCFETSETRNHGNPVFTKHGIVHYCVPNIASRVSRTASIALSNIFAPILHKIGDSGGIKQLLKENIGLRHGIYIYNGILTNKYIGNRFSIRAQDIDLLMAVF